MFAGLTPPEPDKILRIMASFAADPRPEKVDLGVGIYRDAAGRTPVMAAVKEAEARLLRDQSTKAYVALHGDDAFLDALRRLVLGESVAADRVAACATPGGTGAVRQIVEVIRRLAPDATVWTSAPTWPNHHSILDHVRVPWRPYRYYDAEAGTRDAGMWDDLDGVRAGDVILVHGCCHNPTGADLDPGDWRRLGELCADRGAVPFVDLAYLGFGDGLEADAAGLRALVAAVPETLIAVSCSKTFGLYRERAGAVLAVCAGPADARATAALLAHLNRQNYAFPPDHGARAVQTVLVDAALQADWRAELGAMRARMVANRELLARALRDAAGSDRFGYLAGQRGMFSLLPATPDQVETLRADHAIYVVGDGRMNVAGLTETTIPHVARGIAAVL